MRVKMICGIFKCPSCGKIIKKKVLVCPYCGAVLGNIRSRIDITSR